MEAMTPIETKENESDVIFEFTFELRKKANGLKKLFSTIEEIRKEYPYNIFLGLSTENSRVFWIKLFESKVQHPTLQINRHLKSVTPELKAAISKINFAVAYNAKLLFSISDDEQFITVTVMQPESKRNREMIINNFELF